LLTREQTAQIKSVTTKGGALKFETYNKLGALAQLAKILGGAPEPQPRTIGSATVNVKQVNIGGRTARSKASAALPSRSNASVRSAMG
jgi:hypothetical protein